MSRHVRACAGVVVFLAMCASAWAQDQDQTQTQTQMPMQMQMPMAAQHGWTLMQDGIVFANFNHQGGPRGGSEFIAQNWWMGMASREASVGQLTFNGMFSLDPATVGVSGYRQLFQVGEAVDGRPLIDRQHPHDLFMQLAAVWRIPVTHTTGFTVAGGPVGEPALGPVAYMHRASAADNPTAPLSHHTLDSTHIAFGVVTAAVDHGPWLVEGSVFNGREPDQNRWDFDFGRLDSVSVRVWYRPTPDWEFQVSSGHLVSPEELEPGHNVVRTTASGSWTRKNGDAIASVTVAFGINDTQRGTWGAFLAEGARHAGRNTVYGRFEAVQSETALLQTGLVVDSPEADVKDTVLAFTLGAVRDVWSWRGFEGGVGGDITVYGVPAALQPAYSAHPVSFHVFFRLRPPAGAMGRMWNMRMSQPMAGPMGNHGTGL
ncbi:MAG TPA: hypothetical protein VFZ98_05725 [Vicinamibacterales bacterium]